MAFLSLSVRLGVVAACTSLASCGDSPRKSEPNLSPPCPVVGHRLHSVELNGIIYGDIKTRARIANCPNLNMAVAFIGRPPTAFANLQSRAKGIPTVVGFKANADGFVVKESDQQYTLIIVTLENIVEDKRVAPLGPLS